MGIDHLFLVNSSSAVKVDPMTKVETPYIPDDTGAISVQVGDVLKFKNYKDTGFVPINALMLHAVQGDIRATINDNEQDILIVPESALLGISSNRTSQQRHDQERGFAAWHLPPLLSERLQTAALFPEYRMLLVREKPQGR